MFKIIIKSNKSQARLGELTTAHGVIKTPFFMPDATRAGIKNMSVGDLSALKLDAMVVNTFHLYLQPGINLIKKFKGVHNFMNWHKPLLSDSGGYQIFSLIHKNKKLGKISDAAAEFRSPLDGSRHILTPEKSIQIQFDLGVDMMVVLDDCPPNDFDQKQITDSVERTIAWAKRCRLEFDRQIKKRKLNITTPRDPSLKRRGQNIRPLLFGVIQGGMDIELRKKCLAELVKIGPSSDFDGLGFGARHIDSQGNFLKEVLKETAKNIPENYLRFALGVGTPEDIVQSVKLGWDMFDCVIPTREGRHGRIYSFMGCHPDPDVKSGEGSHGKKSIVLSKNFYKIININNSGFAKKTEPINKFSKLQELQNYSLGYLHHLFKIQDPLGQRLAGLNNLEFYLDMMAGLRYGIAQGVI